MSTVKELHPDDRPREKAEKYGLQHLTNAELLAIMLRVGQPGNPITKITETLMSSRQNQFTLLERMTDREFMAIKGIGPVKVLEIRTMLESMRRYAREKVTDLKLITQSSHIYEYMKPTIANLLYEEMWALFLNNAHRVIGQLKVSEGSATSTLFDIKKVLKHALLNDSQAVVLCHNHPSGACQPSGPDRQLTDSFAKACKTLEIRFLDHVIVTTDSFFSFRDQGLI